MAQQSSWQLPAVRPSLRARVALQPPPEELVEPASLAVQRWKLPQSSASPLAERSLPGRRQRWMPPSVPTTVASQSPDPAAREKQSRESASARSIQFAAPGEATEQFSVEQASRLPGYPQQQGPRWPLLRRQLQDDSQTEQIRKNWRQAQTQQASRVRRLQQSQSDAAARPLHHDTSPANHAVPFAAEWHAKHLPAGKCWTNQSSASAPPLQPLQAHWTRTFHHGPGRRAHAWPRLPLPNWSAFSSL